MNRNPRFRLLISPFTFATLNESMPIGTKHRAMVSLIACPNDLERIGHAVNVQDLHKNRELYIETVKDAVLKGLGRYPFFDLETLVVRYIKSLTTTIAIEVDVLTGAKAYHIFKLKNPQTHDIFMQNLQ